MFLKKLWMLFVAAILKHLFEMHLYSVKAQDSIQFYLTYIVAIHNKNHLKAFYIVSGQTLKTQNQKPKESLLSKH